MSLSSGTRLGVYEVTAQIGEGGMGQVYRAHDTTLNRDVALKILPDAFASDPDRLARFTREAQTLAALNHPNIAHIHGLEDSGGVRALVMELVEGEDLSQRIVRGAIPLAEALPIAKQIAEAIEAAHEQGIIHRDLKPANIKVRADGTVKVLDFGLAKAMDPVGSAPDVSQSPTLTSPAMMTGLGVILGTAAYMAPEQARGRAADKRSDVWAFGCVLYEMLTGRRAFEGESVTDVIAAVVTSEPDWTALPTALRTGLRRLLARCLKKDPKVRLQSIGDARIEMDEALAEPATTSNPIVGTVRQTRRMLAAASILLVMVTVASTVLGIRVLSPEPQPAPPSRPVMRLELNLPARVEFYGGNAQSAALSPDGTSVAFVGVLGGVRQIFIRRLDQFDATPLLRGPENPTACFFSPDGRALGFLTQGGGLKKVSLADGLVVPLAAGVDYYGGGAWGTDDRITFGRAGALWQVPATGGAATQVTRIDTGKGELSHWWPSVVADGRVLLFTVVTGSGRDAAHIEALTLATGERQVLVDPGTRPMYSPSGHLIFFRSDVLLAVPFDVDRLAARGPPVRVVENLGVDYFSGAPFAALSNAGALVYASSGQATSQIVWVSRQGLEQQPVIDTPRRYQIPRLSPDGRQIAVSSNGDLWIQDIVRATFTRLTSDDTAGNTYPIWAPDGTRVTFRTLTGLHWIDADGSGRSGAIPGTSVNDYPHSVSPDGGTLVFIRITGETAGDVYALSLRGEPQPRAIVKGPAFEGGSELSPDGRWLAYASDESGQFQVYIRPFPGPDRRWPVSTQGGRQLRWNSNGKELFYREGNKMMAVDILSTGPELVLSPPRLLFDQRYAFGSSLTTANYDVSPDGQRFVMVKDESGSGRLSVVLNWADELKRLVPTQ